jgi:hypothetical protein
MKNGMLVEYRTGKPIRPATAIEHKASRAAAKRDGGRGVILVRLPGEGEELGRDVACYVE